MTCRACKSGIDKKLLPLIRELNNVGLLTQFCCDGHGEDFAYILFNPEVIKYMSLGSMGYGDRSGVSLKWNFTNCKDKTLRCPRCGGVIDKKTGKTMGE